MESDSGGFVKMWVEDTTMRKATMVRAIAGVVLAMAMGRGVVQAQIIDPTTGVTVDATYDPMDFSAVASGQPGNIGMEISAEMIQQSDQQIQAQMQADQAATLTAMNQPSDDTADNTPALPAVPQTPKPTLTPNGGSFKGSVQVTVQDSDPEAALFYTTNGKKPTPKSAQYAAPIAVTAKEKVRVLAVVPGDRPSGVVTKTFKVG